MGCKNSKGGFCVSIKRSRVFTISNQVRQNKDSATYRIANDLKILMIIVDYLPL
jgi:hypothetical protein